MVNLIIILVGAYFLGSIPFGLLIAKLKGIDIRQHGSGNIGATNVYRTLGPTLGVLVFCLDLGKGTLITYVAAQITTNHWLIILTGALAIIGHTFPIFLKFKGGKGAATALGVLLAIAPDICLGAALAAFIIIYITRYVSVGSISTAILTSLAFYLLHRPLPYTITITIITILIIVKHLPNIKRLLNKTENKIRWKKSRY